MRAVVNNVDVRLPMAPLGPNAAAHTKRRIEMQKVSIVWFCKKCGEFTLQDTPDDPPIKCPKCTFDSSDPDVCATSCDHCGFYKTAVHFHFCPACGRDLT